MKYVRQLPDAEELREQLSLTSQQKESRKRIVNQIEDILSGKDNRKILCVGPCSADNEKAVLEYMSLLSRLNEKVNNLFLIIPRVYTSKPRTTGLGYKGLLHRPDTDNSADNLYSGIVATRAMHLHIIQETGFFCSDEMLYPEATYYIADLLGYLAIGARSVENQQHRLVASGMDIPVGMKNPTSGDTDVMLNAIVAAQNPQKLLYHGWECQTDGNLFAHAILRGYRSLEGTSCSNYHYENIIDLHDAYIKRNLKNTSVIVDCNHNNSRKHYDEQIRISKEVFGLCKSYNDINMFVKGLMIESYLVDGNQMIGQGIFGKSITDSCLGWGKTERLVLDLCELLS